MKVIGSKERSQQNAALTAKGKLECVINWSSCKASKCEEKEKLFKTFWSVEIPRRNADQPKSHGSILSKTLKANMLTFVDMLSIGALLMTNGGSLICGSKVHLAPIQQ